MIVQDITDAKRIEDELRHTQKMDAIGQLAGGVAHDFNNLLTVIGGNVELLEEDLPPEDPLHEDLAQISKATTRATSLTKRLLSFSRNERRGTEVRDVNADILDLKKLLMPLIGEDIILGTELTEDPLPVSIEPSELEQILLNLVLNSRDAMPQGGELTIRTERAVIEIDGVDSEAARISVIDTGLGIDEALRGRIFEPFYTTKPLGRGTGLGLSTVYGIVKRVAGQLQVESTTGTGTTMHVTLPLSKAPATLPEATHPDEAPRGDERVLVVEDDALVRRFVERALSDAGYAVTTASTGQEALNLVRMSDTPPDIVLSDVVMPGMTGPELAERLAEIGPDIPLLFMSGYVDQTFLGRELEEHPEQLLRKPFATTALRWRIRDLLDRHRTARVGG
jgi:nitrogen-specific signal transduction histidine kinase/CheY-like chemotaxis protein